MARQEKDYLPALHLGEPVNPELRALESARNIGDILVAHEVELEQFLANQ